LPFHLSRCFVGDFAEIPETCPALTTCPVICVESSADCPTTCSGKLTLCPSGSCQDECSQYDAEEENPCPCPSASVACPPVVDYYEECLKNFMPFYDHSTACLEEQSGGMPHLPYTGPYFVACYTWIITVTCLVVGWCYYNEKVCPGHALTSKRLAQPKTKTARSSAAEVWIQTGYKRTSVGTTIYILVNVTLMGIHFLLFILTIFYYMQEGAITKWAAVFSDTTQVLEVFILVWMIGFPWTMAFQIIPTGPGTLFLRRCPISLATHVVIVAPTKDLKRQDWGRHGAIDRLSRILSWPKGFLLRLLFAHPYYLHGHDVTFCPVQVSQHSSQRFLHHRMRRYVWDEISGGFVQGRIVVGKTFRSFVDQGAGLSHREADLRAEIVGPNRTPLTKPTLFLSLQKEFSRTFYVYQSFILWTW
jgi:hypothetical protein